MCFCNFINVARLTRVGEGMDGTLEFLFYLIMVSSVVRVIANWIFGI